MKNKIICALSAVLILLSAVIPFSTYASSSKEQMLSYIDNYDENDPRYVHILFDWYGTSWASEQNKGTAYFYCDADYSVTRFSDYTMYTVDNGHLIVEDATRVGGIVCDRIFVYDDDTISFYDFDEYFGSYNPINFAWCHDYGYADRVPYFLREENFFPHDIIKFTTNLSSDIDTTVQKNFNFTIENCVDEPYQVCIAIVDKYFNESNLLTEGIQTSYSKWIYSFKDYVITNNLDSKMQDNYYSEVKSYSKNTIYKYLGGGQSWTDTINFSQLPIEQLTDYRLVCIAYPITYDDMPFASELVYADSNIVSGYSDIHILPASSYKVVYNEVFNIKDLTSIPYNPTDVGSPLQVPYEDAISYLNNRYSYNDVYDPDTGELIKKGYNSYQDKNSGFWANNSQYVQNVPSRVPSGTSSTMSTGFNNLIGMFRNVLDIFPPQLMTIVSLTITTLCLIVVIRFLKG